MKFTTIDNRHYKRIDHSFYGNQYVTISRRSRIKRPQTHKPTKPFAHLRAFICLILFATCLIYKLILMIPHAQAAKIISPIPDSMIQHSSVVIKQAKKAIPTPSSTPTSTPTPLPTITPENAQYTAIANDIKSVFGIYAPRAFKLLSCENSRLNPSIKNVNDDQWHSTDWGVFQINDHWQKIGNPAFLTDYDINVRIAWRIFVNNGYRFGVPPTGGWTCGRKLGI